MVNAVNQKWKIPIAYYLVNKLLADDKANLTNELLIHLHDTGAEVVSLTFDGAPSNIAMANNLGANLKDPSNLKTDFPHPCTKAPVYIFLDICHMIKLVRNIFASRGIIYTNNGKIKWDYIKNLESLQSKNELHLGNKLRKNHIMYNNNKMRVKLAVQTISTKVADSLRYLQLKNPDFLECDETIHFLKIFNDLFDIFNSKKYKEYGFKRSLNNFTKNEYFGFFDVAKMYINSLKIQQKVGVNPEKQIIFEIKQLTKTMSKTGFLGFLIAIESFKGLYTNLIDSGRLSYLLGYKFSQDHLETTFSVIRAYGGFNNNPNCDEFRRIMKRILIQNEMKASLSANCEADSTVFLSCGIQKNKKTHQISSFENEKMHAINECSNDDEDLLVMPLTETQDDIVVYISGFVERHLKKTIKCVQCINGITTSNIVQGELIDIKTRGGLIHPQKDIYKICHQSEIFLRSADLSEKNFYPKMVQKIIRNLETPKMFCQSQCNHKIIILKKTIEYFLKIRLHHLAQQETLKTKKTFIRSKFTKIIHFLNQ